MGSPGARDNLSSGIQTVKNRLPVVRVVDRVRIGRQDCECVNKVIELLCNYLPPALNADASRHQEV